VCVLPSLASDGAPPHDIIYLLNSDQPRHGALCSGFWEEVVVSGELSLLDRVARAGIGKEGMGTCRFCTLPRFSFRLFFSLAPSTCSEGGGSAISIRGIAVRGKMEAGCFGQLPYILLFPTTH